MRWPRVEMLAWARSVPASARLNLASTGYPAVRWAELGVDPDRLAALGRDEVGEQGALVEVLARRHGVTAAEIALAPGCTQAAFLALAALLDGAPAGAEVVIETPTYGPLHDLATALGATLVPLPRPRERGFLPDPDELATLVGPRTRAVVLSDLHNPSGVRLGGELSDALLDVVERRSPAHLFVDEVYLELVPGTPPPTAYRSGRRVVTARSPTKAFGLSWIRCGWLQGPPELLRRAVEIDDYATVYLAAPSALACTSALADDEARRERAAARARAGFAVVERRLGAAAGVELVAPCAEAPVICFPRLAATDAGPLVATLLQRHGVAIAPGRLFGAPAHARVACLAAAGALDEGLGLLAELVAAS